ncbi:MAG: hypothetical protein LBO21_03135 [Synergistaceae bacterium]|jgi:hypothetical protein|nr:hypothetical protein [Synergistaceae bacterium]
MADGRGGKILRGVARSGFSLVELVIVCSVIAIGWGSFSLVGGAQIERYSNPLSDYNIDREVDLTVSWLGSVMRRSLTLAEDFEIRTSSYCLNTIKVKWLMGNKDEIWNAGQIHFQSYNVASELATSFSFSHSFQTFSPAFTLAVFIKEGGKFVDTRRRIVVSAHGLISVRRD